MTAPHGPESGPNPTSGVLVAIVLLVGAVLIFAVLALTSGVLG